MAVVSIKEIWNGRRGSLNDKAVREYSRVFRVITNNPKDGPLTVRAAAGLPLRFDAYADPNGVFDLGARARRIEERQSDDPQVWEVEIQYSSETDQAEKGAEDPLARLPEIKWSFEKTKRAIERDLNDDAVVNSAGERFDPPLEIDDSRLVLTVTRNEAIFDPLLALAYQDAANSDSFFGAEADQAKVSSITADSQFENNIFYWKVTYEIHFRREGWRTDGLKLDQGYYELDDDGTKKQIVDKFGNPISAPHPLDGEGKKLTPGNDPVFIQFQVYKSLPFAALGLP